MIYNKQRVTVVVSVSKNGLHGVVWSQSASVFASSMLGLMLLLTVPLQAVQNEPSEGATAFPKGTTLYVEIPRPDRLIDLVADHPLRNRIVDLEPIQQGLNSPQLKMARLGLSFLELRIGEDLLEAVKKLTQGGVYLGADLSRGAIGLALKSEDEALLKKTAGEILGFIKQQGGENAFEIKTYLGGKMAIMNGVVLARYGEWFLISNQESYVRTIAENLKGYAAARGGLKRSLASSKSFLDAVKLQSDEAALWAFVDLASLRKLPDMRPLFQGTTDEPAIELLFGGILEGLEDADYLATGMQLDNQQLKLSVNLPFDQNRISETREFYFGHQAKGYAPPPVEVPGVLGQAVIYRDLGRWWLAKEELFSEKVIANLSLAESQLSTFFGNADFGEEILGALQPGLRLVVKPQEYKPGIAPDIKLPAFALVGRLQNPQRETRFRISFNSFITLLNLSENGSMPQFDVQTMKERGYRVTSAQYLVEDVEDTGLIHYNFSPSIAFQDDFMILASTEDLACELAAATKAWDPEATGPSNASMIVNFADVKRLLELNRESLIAQSMVENNQSREVAAAEMEFLFSIMDFAKQGALDYQIKKQQMTLDITLDLNHDDK